MIRYNHWSFESCRWFTFTHLDGSVRKFVEFAQIEGLHGLWQAWPQPTAEAWYILLSFGLFQAALQRFVPGKRFEGPVTPNGNTPVYQVPACFVLYCFLVLCCFLPLCCLQIYWLALLQSHLITC